MRYNLIRRELCHQEISSTATRKIRTSIELGEAVAPF
jgi:hypothetical protein